MNDHFLVTSEVSAMGDTCLLGLDFLKEYHAIIDLVTSTITLEVNGKKITSRLVEGRVFFFLQILFSILILSVL